MNYGSALDAIKAGKTVTRKVWESSEAFVRLAADSIRWGSKDHPEQHYTPSHPDMLAEDWLEVKDKKGKS